MHSRTIITTVITIITTTIMRQSLFDKSTAISNMPDETGIPSRPRAYWIVTVKVVEPVMFALLLSAAEMVTV
jgi:hypothetical protein